MEVRGKKVTVFGLQRSGIGAARLLDGMGAQVTVTDRMDAERLAQYLSELPLTVKTVLGGHPDEVVTGADMIVLSPGVPMSIPPIRLAMDSGVRIIGELELAFEALSDRGLPFYAITGTNGKSTTTALLDLMLKKAGRRPLTGGNIGNSITAEIVDRNIDEFDCVVVEVSSFQLEAVDEFRPAVASILNITPDHMDRYSSMDEYSSAKARMFERQDGEDFLVMNADDPVTSAMGHDAAGRRPGLGVYFFSRTAEVRGVYIRDGAVWCDMPGKYSGRLMGIEDIQIKGVHNLENAMAASAMALLAECPAGPVADALKEFPGLEHRLEFVRELDGVRYINDSKGTNVDATVKSIESFGGGIILIAGGRDKAGDFTKLRKPLEDRVKCVLLIGEAAEKIARAVGDVVEVKNSRDMADAVAEARALARPGDVVLLSPACASFDMFRDFEHRGRVFKEEVGALC